MVAFTVLHVCMGNICRSPMAERLLTRMVADRVAVPAPVRSYSAGTGGWHAGEEMNPPAARQVLARGGNVDGFAARKLRGEHIDAADLVLTATGDQYDYVVALRPDAAPRTFVLGEFGRLLAALDPTALSTAESRAAESRAADPVAAQSAVAASAADAVHARGTAIVVAADAVRAGDTARPGDDLDDPWGRGDQTFTRIGDEIEQSLRPFTALLLP